MGDKKGLQGRVYGISVLPNTARQLVEAIQTQPDLSKENALEMADYLDQRYGMSDYIPTNHPTTNNNEEG